MGPIWVDHGLYGFNSPAKPRWAPCGWNLGHAQLGLTWASLDGPHIYQPTKILHGLAQMGLIWVVNGQFPWASPDGPHMGLAWAILGEIGTYTAWPHQG